DVELSYRSHGRRQLGFQGLEAAVVTQGSFAGPARETQASEHPAVAQVEAGGAMRVGAGRHPQQEEGGGEHGQRDEADQAEDDLALSDLAAQALKELELTVLIVVQYPAVPGVIDHFQAQAQVIE